MSKTPSPYQHALEAEAEASKCRQRIGRIKQEKAALKIDPSKPAVDEAKKIRDLENKSADELAIQEHALRITEEKLPALWEAAKAELLPQVRVLESQAREIQPRALAAVKKALLPLLGDVHPIGANPTLHAAENLVRDVWGAVNSMLNDHTSSYRNRVDGLQNVIETAPTVLADIEAGIAKLEAAADFLTAHFPAADETA